MAKISSFKDWYPNLGMPKRTIYGRLSKNDPNKLIYLNAYSQGVVLFESIRIRNCGLAGMCH